MDTQPLNNQITWEEKIRMVELHNSLNENKISFDEFSTYVLTVVPNFDLQAWEMLITMITLNSDYIREHFSFFKEIQPYVDSLLSNNDSSYSKLPITTQLRLNILKTNIEEEENNAN